MKLKNGFITHNTGAEHVLVSVGGNGFSGLVRNNATAAFLVERMKEETTEEKLVDALLEKYEVSREQAQRDVRALVEKLAAAGVLDV